MRIGLGVMRGRVKGGGIGNFWGYKVLLDRALSSVWVVGFVFDTSFYYSLEYSFDTKG